MKNYMGDMEIDDNCQSEEWSCPYRGAKYCSDCIVLGGMFDPTLPYDDPIVMSIIIKALMDKLKIVVDSHNRLVLCLKDK